MDNQQLWTLTSAECMLLSHTTHSGPILKKCPKLPVVYWPDGRVCFPVTMWLIECSRNRRASHSASRRGSTSTTDASLISLFVRYMANSAIEFENMSDDHMFHWANQLAAERDLSNSLLPRRHTTQIGRIMRKAIQFLLWYQDSFLQHRSLIGRDIGCQVRITEEHGRSRKGHAFQYMQHRAIPKNSVPNDVKPIGHAQITKLYDAIRHSTRNAYVRSRRRHTLRILEAVGGRRLEISQITVDDVRKAFATEMLVIKSVKRSDGKSRQVPVDRSWIAPVIDFIETQRKRLVNDLIRDGVIEADPGFLFLGIRGHVISEETITKEVTTLARLADISEKACPHMFRHRFITIQVAYRLKEYIDQELPMDVAHTILTKVAELTGHRDPMSLWRYIDLGFDELKVWDTAERVLRFRARAEGTLRQLETLLQETEGCFSQSALTQAMDLLRNVADVELGTGTGQENTLNR